MLSAIDPSMLWLALTLIGAGAVAGFLAGMFGIGGGAILVPVLYQFLGFLHVDDSIKMYIAVATSLGIIIPTSLRSFFSHRKRGAVDEGLLKSLIIAVPLGAILGMTLANYISANGLKGAFAIITMIVAFKLLFAKDSWRLGDDLPGRTGRNIAGVIIGFFSALIGIGGGVLTNTFMTLYNRPIDQAVATSSGVGVLISVPAAIGYMISGWGTPGLPHFSLGYVNFLAIILIIPVTILIAPLGVRVAHALPKDKLSKAFGLLLVAVSIRFFLALH